MSHPIVAIVGRPNVGKSTLFNRLVGQRFAITAEKPGTTRDRLLANIDWQDRHFAVVDTAGLDSNPDDAMHASMMGQVRLAIEEAQAVIFMVDVMDGVTPADADVAAELRRSGRPIVLAANKADNPKRELGSADFYSLGLGQPMLISAYHNSGIGDLLDRVTGLLPQTSEQPPSEGMRLAIVGRPNVGKSMLLNAVLGEERAVVSEVPGTTRDSIDTQLTYHGEPVTLIDTAGIRKRGRIERGVEKYSVLRSVRAIERADIALLLLDASELIAAQDTHIAGYVLEAFKGMVIVINKWDLADQVGLTTRECERMVSRKFRFAPFAPIIYTSALNGTGLREVLKTAKSVWDERTKRVGTGELNRAVERAVGENLPRLVGKRRLHILYATQASVNPPTFVFFSNNPKLLHFSYRRYLENRLREAFGFTGTPLRFVFKSRDE